MRRFPLWHRSWLMPCRGSYCLPAEQNHDRKLRGVVRYRGGVVKPVRLLSRLHRLPATSEYNHKRAKQNIEQWQASCLGSGILPSLSTRKERPSD